jgi:mono/diheme cytochrome c family protein
MTLESKFLIFAPILITGAVLLAGCRSASVGTDGGSPTMQLGSKVFAENCAACHGKDATGSVCPNLHGLSLSNQQIALIVRQGKGKMPAFGTALPARQQEAVVAYIASLQAPAQGATPAS